MDNKKLMFDATAEIYCRTHLLHRTFNA